MTKENKISITIWFGILALIIVVLIALNWLDKQRDIKPVETAVMQEYEALASVKSTDPTTSAQKRGIMSWYRYKIGDWTNENALVCASRDFPRHSWIRIHYRGNSIDCKVTDFGPAKEIHPDRIVDVSPRIFRALAENGLEQGLLKGVEIEQLN